MRKVWLAAILLGFGCAPRSLGGGIEDGGAGDGARSADLAPLGDLGLPDLGGCAGIVAATAEWLDSHVACQRDEDCVWLYTTCGLPGMCGIHANTGAAGAYLESLITAWQRAGCYALPPCECAPPPTPPGCNAGRCGFREPRGQIGDPCQGGFDCVTGRCLDAAANPSFPGGYCTSDCGAGGTCPAGSSCRAIAGGQYCLEDCQPGAPACRAGYACCAGGPGPVSTTPVCAPSASIYCLGL
ncbi:MAG TPA: hypothetical protein VH877_13445 [Polyangia bacterium]|nr:hypothetical protein [Polyangia bacterium]